MNYWEALGIWWFLLVMALALGVGVVYFGGHK